MSCTKGKIDEEGITVYKLVQYFSTIPGAEETAPTITKRLQDQKWSYVQARALQIAGLWEPENVLVTKAAVRKLFSGRISGQKPEEVVLDSNKWDEDGRFIND